MTSSPLNQYRVSSRRFYSRQNNREWKLPVWVILNTVIHKSGTFCQQAMCRDSNNQRAAVLGKHVRCSTCSQQTVPVKVDFVFHKEKGEDEIHA